MPKEGRNSYPLVACTRWYIDHFRGKAKDVSNQISREKRRLLKAQASLRELELKTKITELIPADQAKQKWAQHITAAKTKLLGIKARCAPFVREVLDDDHAAHKLLDMIEGQVLEALNELAGK